MANRWNPKAKLGWYKRSQTTKGSASSIPLHSRRGSRKPLLRAHPQGSSSLRNRHRAEACRQLSRPEDLEEALQSILEPHPGNHQQQNACQDAGSHDGPREGVNLRHKLPLLSGHMFPSRTEKDLVVFVAFEEAPPKKQAQEYGGNDSPGDQQVKQWPR